MKYQKGTVFPQGKRVKMWYGKYLVYRRDQHGKEVCTRRTVALCPKAEMPKWKAEQKLNEIILKETKGVGPTPTLPPDDSVTFSWFVRERYISMRRGSWSPTYKKTNTYNLEHYLIEHFDDLPLRELTTFEIQIWLNNLVEAKDYSESVVRSCFNNIRAITHLARKQKFLTDESWRRRNHADYQSGREACDESGAEPLSARSHRGPARSLPDVHRHLQRAARERGDGVPVEILDRRVPSASRHRRRGEVLQGKGQVEGEPKTNCGSRTGPPGDRGLAEDLPGRISGGADVSHFRTGERKGEAVPRHAKNFLRWRIRPLSQKLGIPNRLVTFQVMRRSLGTHMQDHGTLKDTQGALRHASITTTGNVTCRWSRRASCALSTPTPTRYSMAGLR
jgi:hypothetical protein